MSESASVIPDAASEPTVEQGEGRSEFIAGLMPKAEIGADDFRKSQPETCDGRGVIIAIFDSGVDPGAAGLTTTPYGEPKVLDVLDCTGSGDVDTSKVVKADNDGYLTGSSGRRLQVYKDWLNPSGEWHVGSKHVFQLFTRTLVSRLKKERKKSWEPKQREAVTEAVRGVASVNKSKSETESEQAKKEKEDKQARLELLQKLAEDFDDKGPVVDCVVWHDGKVWRAALDTTELDGGEEGTSNLASFTPLTNFRLEHKYGMFSKVDACNFVLNIYDEGNVLSIVTDSSPHGTHVAGITAAYHPEEAALNGVAPGAQIVSCKIGDSRLDGMETGTGLTRALIAVIENKCELINMSYGEPAALPDAGRFIELANEVVNKHGVIFVSSAGNNGPALSTVGAPGGTSSAIIGIGAFVSPAMAAAAHSLVEPPAEGQQYTWSSRGPTADGDLGVSLSAPGGAVAPVPAWTLQGRQLMNGTSMSSPCATGGIALLLSAIKAKGNPVWPHVARKALENTAKPVGKEAADALTHGHGLMQVQKALEYVEHAKEALTSGDMWYKVTVERTGDNGPSRRGIYLRDLPQTQVPSEFRATVEPKFHEDVDNLEKLVPFEEHVKLTSSAPSWLKCPDYLLLPYNGRNFCVRVDPNGLPEGVHYAEVIGTDLDASWRGPLFRIPVTIIRPKILSPPGPFIVAYPNLTFTPGHIERRFISVPEGATWAEVTVRAGQQETPRQYVLHTLQLANHERHTKFEKRSYLVMHTHTSKTVAVEVAPSLTLEVVLAHFWSSAAGASSPATVDLEVEFHGLSPSRPDIHIDGTRGPTKVDIRAPLGPERLVPAATLNKLQLAFAPVEGKIEPLSTSRDTLPDGRQIHALTLQYKVSLSEGGKWTPRLPALNDRIYDNEFESQFYMVHDANKRVVSQGDVYPHEEKLTKGDYTIRYHIRHDNVSYLDKLKKSRLVMERTLEDKSSVKLSTHSVFDGALTNSKTLKSSQMLAGEVRSLYLAPPADDKLPKDAALGAVLRGWVTFGKVGSNGDSPACPTGYSISYSVPPAVKEEKKAGGSGKKKAPAEMLSDELRDTKVKVLSGLAYSSEEETAEYWKLAEQLKAEYPTHLPLLLELLKRLDDQNQEFEKRKESAPKVIEAANTIVSTVERPALAAYFAMKSEPEGEDPTVKKDMEAARDALVEALSRKALALLDLQIEVGSVSSSKDEMSTEEEGPGTSGEGESGESGPGKKEQEEFEETYKEFCKWTDVGQAKHSLLVCKRERRAGRLGLALKALNKLIDDESKATEKSTLELRAQLYRELGWKHWAKQEQDSLLLRFPACYPLF